MAVDDEAGDQRGSRRANTMDAHVGARVRLRRVCLGMSQEKLGEALGLTFQQVQKYEKGTNRIGASRLYDLAQVLSVAITYFYDEAPTDALLSAPGPGFAERAPEPYMTGFLNSREGIELTRAFQRIGDPKVRRSIIDLCRSLANGAADAPVQVETT